MEPCEDEDSKIRLKARPCLQQVPDAGVPQRALAPFCSLGSSVSSISDIHAATAAGQRRGARRAVLARAQ